MLHTFNVQREKYMKKRVAIVYFAYINPKKNWKAIISGQINDIKQSGILNDADLYIEVNNSSASSDVKDFFESLSSSSLKQDLMNIEYHQDNTFEYHGIHKVWELANTDSYEYLVYLHTKGMSYKKALFGLLNGRNLREKILTYYTFKDYKNTIDVFDNEKEVIRAGFMPKCDDSSSDVTGCIIWFNFYWIRASYAKTLEEPVITDNRFYYEGWSSKNEGERGDAYKKLTYCLYTKDHSAFSIDEASDILKKLRKVYKYTWPVSALLRKLRLKGN